MQKTPAPNRTRLVQRNLRGVFGIQARVSKRTMKQFQDDQDYTFLVNDSKVTISADNLPDALKLVPRDSLLIAVNGDPRF